MCDGKLIKALGPEKPKLQFEVFVYATAEKLEQKLYAKATITSLFVEKFQAGVNIRIIRKIEMHIHI